MRTIGVVLAGGQSRRFGSPKAFATIDGEYFYERICRLLAELCNDVIIVTREELLLQFPKHMNVITDCDEYKGNGPLSGIYSAMKQEQAERYLVLPCDMPFLTVSAIKKLVDAASSDTANLDAVFSITLEEVYHPLVSIWPYNMKQQIKQVLEKKQYSVMKLLANAKVVWLNGEVLFDNAQFILQNINIQDQMKEVNRHDSIS